MLILLIAPLTAVATLIFFFCSKCSNLTNAAEPSAIENSATRSPTSDATLDPWQCRRSPVAINPRERNRLLNQHLTELRGEYIRVWRTYMALLLASDADRSATAWQWAGRRCQFEWTVLRLRLDPALKPFGLGLERGQAASLGIRLLRAQLQLITASSGASSLSRG